MSWAGVFFLLGLMATFVLVAEYADRIAGWLGRLAVRLERASREMEK